MSIIKDRGTKTYRYPAVFHYEKGQATAVTFPDFDASTCGDTDEEARAAAEELLSLTLFGLKEDGEPIPRPTALKNVKLEDGERAELIHTFLPARIKPVKKRL